MGTQCWQTAAVDPPKASNLPTPAKHTPQIVSLQSRRSLVQLCRYQPGQRVLLRTERSSHRSPTAANVASRREVQDTWRSWASSGARWRKRPRRCIQNAATNNHRQTLHQPQVFWFLATSQKLVEEKTITVRFSNSRRYTVFRTIHKT